MLNRHERRRIAAIRRRREQLPVQGPYPVNGTAKQCFFWGLEFEFRKLRDREGMTLKQYLVMGQADWKAFRDGNSAAPSSDV